MVNCGYNGSVINLNATPDAAFNERTKKRERKLATAHSGVFTSYDRSSWSSLPQNSAYFFQVDQPKVYPPEPKQSRKNNVLINLLISPAHEVAEKQSFRLVPTRGKSGRFLFFILKFEPETTLNKSKNQNWNVMMTRI